ncbi:hypothetical protein V1517DRAFT_319386 [Lipomyces orientalis]|uniref:Uncharacterized protein n=1 Tax=Lipomyces orientalis TaxID=1233043 RepID=A0ACC3TRJ9_9ASCO
MRAKAGLGSWIVTFIVTERHGRRSSTDGRGRIRILGRLNCRSDGAWVCDWPGENTMATVYLILSIIFELVFWRAPSIVASAAGVVQGWWFSIQREFGDFQSEDGLIRIVEFSEHFRNLALILASKLSVLSKSRVASSRSGGG